MKTKLIIAIVSALALVNINAQEPTFSQQCEALSQAKDWAALATLVASYATGDYNPAATSDTDRQRNTAIIYRGRVAGQVEGYGKLGGSNPEALAYYREHKVWGYVASIAATLRDYATAIEAQTKLVSQDPSDLNQAVLLKYKRASGADVNIEALATVQSKDTIDARLAAALFEAWSPARGGKDGTLEFYNALLLRIPLEQSTAAIVGKIKDQAIKLQ